VAVPLELLVAELTLKLPPLTLVKTEKLTISPATGLPLTSLTVATTETLAPGRTDVGLACKLTVRAGPGTNVTVIFADRPVIGSRTVTSACPDLVDDLRKTVACPLLPVVALTALTEPALVVKFKDVPEIGLPLMSVRVASSRTVDWPSAVMLGVAPCAEVIVRLAGRPVVVPELLLVLLPELEVLLPVTPLEPELELDKPGVPIEAPPQADSRPDMRTAAIPCAIDRPRMNSPNRRRMRHAQWCRS
jgi:hypothetical protein